MRKFLHAICLLLVSGCGDSNEPGTVNVVVPAPVVDSPPASPAPSPTTTAIHNYEEKDGDAYLYVTAVSEEDEKKGKAVGDVVTFRYRGESDGVHRLDSLDSDGRTLLRYECSTPCRIIKRRLGGKVERIPYNPGSVIGAAFEDALNGRLEVSRADRKDSGPSASAAATPSADAVAAIPAAFVGEWNEDLSACGTGNNDSRLRIEPKRLRFYESDAEVSAVTVRSSRAVTVHATFTGEGQVWSDKVELVLSRSGDDLTTTGGFTRHRCR